ncbi:MAG: caspase family protein, partial [Bradyrhizobium sp.]|uniref:caspase family protein n=1 Tax=Bradyrhizobium sp. TaxID=376 RepID=UPI0027313C09
MRRPANCGRLGLAALVALLFAILSGPAAAEKRIALVVGNAAYQNITRLDNPSNDARLMADTLSSLGFTLIGGRAQLDLDKSALDTAVQNFGRHIQGADVALFFYAGHGVQVSGSNYLVPVGANPTREADVDFQMVDVNLVLRQMQGSGTRLNMVILDACRNNPFGARGLRAADGGLAQMRAPEGTLISYATQPGSVAQDGNDGHSPYTKALAATIRQAGLDIFQTFNQVGLAVKRQTGGSQQPWVSSSPIDGTFYFVPPVATASPQVAAAPPRLSDTLRPDPDRVPIKDTVLLRELSDRLYERNFDPEPLDSKNGMKLAIAKFQEKSSMTPTGEATEGVLTRLRKMEDLKPWGSIVYGPDSDKWGISWNHASRKAAVDDARSNCGAGKCPVELSFYGTRCGAFAISGKSWSLVARDTV